MKKALITGFAALSTMFAVAQTQTEADESANAENGTEMVAENVEATSSNVVTPEFTDKAKTTDKDGGTTPPFVKSGNAYDARTNSHDKKNVTVYLYHSSNDALDQDAQFYIDEYTKSFADTSVTDNPQNVEFIVFEGDASMPTHVKFYTSGDRFRVLVPKDGPSGKDSEVKYADCFDPYTSFGYIDAVCDKQAATQKFASKNLTLTNEQPTLRSYCKGGYIISV